MAEDSVVLSRPVAFDVVGELGEVPADVATPLAVVLAELLQNAVEHAFADGDTDGHEPSRPGGVGTGGGPVAVPPIGHIQVHLVNDLSTLTLEVIDDGCGLPPGFDIEETQSLGLSIVRDLVRSQMEGTITMRNRADLLPGTPGTVVAIELKARESGKVGL
jgi:two-component sensor histidine kinase